MTSTQIFALLLAGPVGLIQLLHVARTFKGGDFNLGQALLLFACIVVILIAFLGAK